MTDDAVQVVRLTPEGRGAVAALLVEGPAAVERVDRHLFRIAPGRLPSQPLNRIQHTHWGAPDGEDVVVCRVGPTEVEVHSHGGWAAIDRIAAELAGDACEPGSWHDWVARREPNAIRREGRRLLPKARTERTAAILLDQYAGALEAAIAKVIEALDTGRSDDAKGGLQILFDRAPIGLHLVEPWRVVVTGPPNVGKSSLINALVGYSRSIVFDQPGTTRDVVTAITAIDGWPIELSDTAGLRTSDDPLEQAGVELARQQIRAADCIVSVADASDLQLDRIMFGTSLEVPCSARASLRVVNKCDLASRKFLDKLASERWPPHLTSAITGEGVAELSTAIVKQLVGDRLRPADAVPFTSSQVAHIRQAMDALERRDSRSAHGWLGGILS
jgi:tRNA modification GTPase